MKQIGAVQFLFTLVKRTRRLPIMQRLLFIGAGAIIYGAFYVKQHADDEQQTATENESRNNLVEG